jgi:hypothetical protein
MVQFGIESSYGSRLDRRLSEEEKLDKIIKKFQRKRFQKVSKRVSNIFVPFWSREVIILLGSDLISLLFDFASFRTNRKRI